MSTIPENIEDLIIESFDSTLSDENYKIIKLWRKESPENDKIYREYIDMWHTSSYINDKREFNSDVAYNRCNRAMQPASSRVNRKLIMSIIRYAAILVLTVGVSGALFYNQGKESVIEQLANVDIEVPNGSTLKTTLPDGTVVELNSGTKLSYSQSFSITNREIKIDGEGYFDVTKNRELPFIINSSEVEIKVLGTKFNFKNSSEDIEAEVALYEGSIQFTPSNNDQRTIVPNDIIVYNKLSGDLQITHDNIISSESSWQSGVLEFNEVLLSDIVRKLNRSYDTNITIESDELASRRFYCSFDTKTMTLQDVIELLCRTNSFRYRLDENDDYVLYIGYDSILE